MEFPITKEQLKTCSSVIEKELDREWVEVAVDLITNLILQCTYTPSKANQQRWLNYNSSCYSVIGPTSLRISLPLAIQGKGVPIQSLYRARFPYYQPDMKQLFPTILETIKSRFPDTSFQVDPLQTYILIDWA